MSRKPFLPESLDGIDASANSSPASDSSSGGGSDDSADGTNGSGAIQFEDPIQASGDIGNREPGTGDAPRKRGRPKGSGGKAQAQRDIGVEGIAGILTVIHAGLSAVIPEMEIDEKEANSLSRALTNLMRQYDIKQSEKAIAWSGVIGVCATVYVPRAFAIRTRIATEHAEKRRSNVQPIRPQGLL